MPSRSNAGCRPLPGHARRMGRPVPLLPVVTAAQALPRSAMNTNAMTYSFVSAFPLFSVSAFQRVRASALRSPHSAVQAQAANRRPPCQSTSRTRPRASHDPPLNYVHPTLHRHAAPHRNAAQVSTRARILAFYDTVLSRQDAEKVFENQEVMIPFHQPELRSGPLSLDHGAW